MYAWREAVERYPLLPEDLLGLLEDGKRPTLATILVKCACDALTAYSVGFRHARKPVRDESGLYGADFSQTAHGILRVIAFVLLCIGVQITWNGIEAMLKIVVKS